MFSFLFLLSVEKEIKKNKDESAFWWIRQNDEHAVELTPARPE